MQTLTLKQLSEVWSKILGDRRAQKALERLEKAGFPLAHLSPRDPTFRHPTWADYIAAIPLVPNRPSRRRIHTKSSLRKYRPLVRKLRQLAKEDPFCEVQIVSGKDYPLREIAELRERLMETADLIEFFLSWDWYIRERNQRNALIAGLRWQFRERTGKPHDAELNVLINAAYRAAGVKEGCHIHPQTLDRIEKREMEGRVKATRRLRFDRARGNPG